MDLEPSFNILQCIDTDLLLGTITIVMLLFCSAMVSAAEVALFSLTQNDLNRLSLKSASKGILITNLLQKPKKLLVTLLVANNFINIGVVIIFSYHGNNIFSQIETPVLKFILEVILVTFLILLFGEVFPKIYASRNNVKFSRIVINPLLVLDKILSPISLPMLAITIYLHNKLGKQKSNI